MKHSGIMPNQLLLRVLCANVAVVAGAYVHAPWFGEASIFDSTIARHSRTLFPGGVKVGLAPSTLLAVSVLPGSSGHIQATWSNVERASAQDLLVLTCAGMEEWSFNEGFDAVHTASRGAGSGTQSLPNRTALPDLRCQYVVRCVQSARRSTYLLLSRGVPPSVVHTLRSPATWRDDVTSPRYIRREEGGSRGGASGVIVAEAPLQQDYGLRCVGQSAYRSIFLHACSGGHFISS